MKPTREDLQRQLERMDTDTMLLDDLDAACIGFTWAANGNCLAVYDESLCIQALQAQGMDLDDAREHYEKNIASSYLGHLSPIFITPVCSL